FSTIARLRATPLHRLSVRSADRVIANSQQTKRDMIEFFGVSDDTIDVVYPAAAEIFFERPSAAEIAAERRRRLGDDSPYFVFVGKLSRRRHVPNLIAAFAELRKSRDLPHKLLIVGPNTTNTNVEEHASAAGVGDAVVHLDHLDQASLARLYAGSFAFVLPTTYEGISQTMFEAMASETAVVTVDHPTVHEGAGDTVVIAPSPSVRDLAEGARRPVSSRGRAMPPRRSRSSTAWRPRGTARDERACCADGLRLVPVPPLRRHVRGCGHRRGLSAYAPRRRARCARSRPRRRPRRRDGSRPALRGARPARLERLGYRRFGRHGGAREGACSGGSPQVLRRADRDAAVRRRCIRRRRRDRGSRVLPSGCRARRGRARPGARRCR